MTVNETVDTVLDELAQPAEAQEPDWADVVERAHVRASRPRGGKRRRPRLLVVAAAAAVLVGAGTAYGVAERFLIGDPAPEEYEASLQALFPPARIGEATTLARYAGRTLFGARTADGRYCFSATSPIDPKAEGGTCLSARDTKLLEDGRMVAFPLSGGTVGGQAPGAVEVRVTGAGIDATFPVETTGWWVGAVGLSIPVPRGVDGHAVIVATGVDAAGAKTGRDRVLEIGPPVRPGVVVGDD